MPIHNVLFELPQMQIANSNLIFTIRKNGRQLGKVAISKGGLEYFNGRSKTPIKINWSDFHDYAIDKQKSIKR